jgi:hypothetical protein
MDELNGLCAILASKGTLHSIEEPPDPLEWRTAEEYEAARYAWWVRATFWHAETRDAP